MTLVAIAGIEDLLRPGVREAAASCHRAGVTVKMCTRDNVLTARSIATECDIYTAGGLPLAHSTSIFSEISLTIRAPHHRTPLFHSSPLLVTLLDLIRQSVIFRHSTFLVHTISILCVVLMHFRLLSLAVPREVCMPVPT